MVYMQWGHDCLATSWPLEAKVAVGPWALCSNHRSSRVTMNAWLIMRFIALCAWPLTLRVQGRGAALLHGGVNSGSVEHETWRLTKLNLFGIIKKWSMFSLVIVTLELTHAWTWSKHDISPVEHQSNDHWGENTRKLWLVIQGRKPSQPILETKKNFMSQFLTWEYWNSKWMFWQEVCKRQLHW